MTNEVGADAMIAMFDAKYHNLFWRPVTAINPTSMTTDGYAHARLRRREPGDGRAGRLETARRDSQPP